MEVQFLVPWGNKSPRISPLVLGLGVGVGKGAREEAKSCQFMLLVLNSSIRWRWLAATLGEIWGLSVGS